MGYGVILKDVINIACDSLYPWTWWAVTDEPLNTFQILELLIPISKKGFILVLFKFPKNDRS